MHENALTAFRRSLRVGVALRVAGMIGLMVLGGGLAALGFALVLDVLSLRELLAEHGPSPLWRLVFVARAHLAHVGAQAGELAAGVAGLVLAVACGRGLAVARR